MKNILKLGLSVLVVAFLAGCGGGGGGGSGSGGSGGGSGSGSGSGGGAGGGAGNSEICGDTKPAANTFAWHINDRLSVFPDFDDGGVQTSSRFYGVQQVLPDSYIPIYNSTLEGLGFILDSESGEYVKEYGDSALMARSLIFPALSIQVFSGVFCNVRGSEVSSVALNTEFGTDMPTWPIYHIQYAKLYDDFNEMLPYFQAHYDKLRNSGYTCEKIPYPESWGCSRSVGNTHYGWGIIYGSNLPGNNDGDNKVQMDEGISYY